MPTYERLDYGSDDGSQWGGASTDKLALYGNTPVVQYTDTFSTSTYPTYSQSTASATTFGFASALHLANFMGTVSSMRAALVRYGMIQS